MVRATEKKNCGYVWRKMVATDFGISTFGIMTECLGSNLNQRSSLIDFDLLIFHLKPNDLFSEYKH